jgi:hypothetical protein
MRSFTPARSAGTLIFFLPFRPTWRVPKKVGPRILTLSWSSTIFFICAPTLAGKERAQVVGVAEQVGRCQHRPGRHLLGDVLRRDVAHLQVVALQRHQLGALAEQRGVQVHLDLEIGGHVLGEHVHHLGADVLVGEHGSKAQRGRSVWAQAGSVAPAASAASAEPLRSRARRSMDAFMVLSPVMDG